MTFTAGIPLDTDDPSVSAGQFRNNFNALDTMFGNNHVTFTAGANNGKHNFCQFPEQGAAPATAANENAIYSADTGTQPDLFYRPESNGTAVRLTGGGITAGAYGTFTGATPPVLSANSFNISGVVRNSIGNWTVSFTRNFANTDFVVSISVNRALPNVPAVFGNLSKNVNNINFETRSSTAAALVDPTNIEVVIFGILA